MAHKKGQGSTRNGRDSRGLFARIGHLVKYKIGHGQLDYNEHIYNYLTTIILTLYTHSFKM